MDRRILYLFDTSALIAHIFDEAGADTVQSLFRKAPGKIGICVLSITELKGRLRSEIEDQDEVHEICSRYFDFLTIHVNIDRAVAELAEHIRVTSNVRIPLIDAVIAASARSKDAVLVHRDPYFNSIPEGVVRQLNLAE